VQSQVGILAVLKQLAIDAEPQVVACKILLGISNQDAIDKDALQANEIAAVTPATQTL
jgi:hypothetical protein